MMGYVIILLYRHIVAKALEVEQELQQLMDERESNEVLVSKENLYNKENEVTKKSKPLFHFTPSAHDESSLARLVGVHKYNTRKVQ